MAVISDKSNKQVGALSYDSLSDSLMQSLTSQFGLSTDFLLKLKPLLDKIFDNNLSEAVRAILIEQVYATCVQQQRIQAHTEQALLACQELKQDLQQWTTAIRHMVVTLQNFKDNIEHYRRMMEPSQSTIDRKLN